MAAMEVHSLPACRAIACDLENPRIGTSTHVTEALSSENAWSERPVPLHELFRAA
jgi:hypothetical protein